MPGILENPFLQTGAGILAASSPLTPSSQAIGLGLMGGHQMALDLQKRRENAALAELQRQQIMQAMEQKRREQEFRQRLRQRAPQIASEMVAPGLEGPLAPEQQAQAGLMQYALEADPEIAGRILERRAAMKPTAPQIKTVQEGDEVVTYSIGPGGGMQEIGRGPKWNPNPSNMQVNLGLQKPVQTRLQNQLLSNKEVIDTMNQIRQIAKPEDFGATGWFRQTYQDLVAQGNAITQVFRPIQVDATLNADKNASPGKWFDPALPMKDYLMNALAYLDAKRLNPGDRVSNQDFEQARDRLVRRGPLASIDDMNARFDALETNIRLGSETARQALENQTIPGLPAAGGDDLLNFLNELKGP